MSGCPKSGRLSGNNQLVLVLQVKRCFSCQNFFIKPPALGNEFPFLNQYAINARQISQCQILTIFHKNHLLGKGIVIQIYLLNVPVFRKLSLVRSLKTNSGFLFCSVKNQKSSGHQENQYQEKDFQLLHD
jgi:hypothetical protein